MQPQRYEYVRSKNRIRQELENLRRNKNHLQRFHSQLEDSQMYLPPTNDYKKELEQFQQNPSVQNRFKQAQQLVPLNRRQSRRRQAKRRQTRRRQHRK